MQILLQNCEKKCRIIGLIGQKRTNSVRGLYDKNKGLNSTVYLGRMRKSMFKRLVYTPPDSLPRFTSKLNLSNTKNPA